MKDELAELQSTSIEGEQPSQPETTPPPETPPQTETKPSDREPEKTISEPDKPIPENVEGLSRQEYDSLKKKVDLYEQLLADKVRQSNVPQQAQQEKPKEFSWDDAIQTRQEDLENLLSGDPTRAKPVLVNFARAIHQIVVNSMYQEAQQRAQLVKYATDCKAEYANRFKDTLEYPEIVQVIGDAVGAKYGNTKLPHEYLDEIGNASRAYIAKVKGTNGTQPTTRTRNTGEGFGGTKPQVPAKPELTDQQKEMLDTLKDM